MYASQFLFEPDSASRKADILALFYPRRSPFDRMFYRDGYETLITALYFKGDPYLKSYVFSCNTILDQRLTSPLTFRSDAVFGVKTSLIVDPQLVTDQSKAKALGFKEGPYWYLQKDYVLLTSAQAEEQKRKSLANYYGSLQ